MKEIKKKAKPKWKSQMILCRICSKEIPRTREKGSPQLYCCQQHRKAWRKEYRQVWHQKRRKEGKLVEPASIKQ